MHNCERQVRASVQEILDIAAVVAPQIAIVIVDNGSTDDTYDTACEVAKQYPQLTVLRQSVHQGMGTTLELVRNRLSVEIVLVHDGTSTIDASQIQLAVQANRQTEAQRDKPSSPNSSLLESAGSRRFAAVRDLHDRMAQAHRLATSFRWIQLEKPLVPRRRQTLAPASPGLAPPATSAPSSIHSPISLTNLPAIHAIPQG
jgi:glycosyltransferase involved in cell wall biosynthesis